MNPLEIFELEIAGKKLSYTQVKEYRSIYRRLIFTKPANDQRSAKA